MNRGIRLWPILKDGKEHCSFDLTKQLGTAAFRAACELRKTLSDQYDLLTVDFHHHEGKKKFAVYQLIRKEPEQMRIL